MKKLTVYTFLILICAITTYLGQETINVSSLPSITGESPGDHFGGGKYAGDVNGDGYDDFIIGAGLNDENGLDAGKAYVYYGGTTFDTNVDIEFLGESPGDRYGNVLSACDVNADGYNDLLIGAPLNDANGNESGRTYVYFGGENMDNIPDIIISGNAGDRLCIVRSAGDLNGDGIDDFMVGTSFSKNTGYVEVYFGGQNLDAEPELIIFGDSAEDVFGSFLSSAGDVNGDGFDDILVSDPGNFAEALGAGRAYIYFGGQNMDNIADVIMTGNEVSGYFGWGVSTAGDVNNDGYDDILVGARAEDAGGHDNGNVYLFLGSSNFDNIVDVIFTGKHYEEGFGNNLASAGNVNGDGFDDFLIGTRGKGKAYLYLGKGNITDNPDIIFEEENDGDGLGTAYNVGDINGDGLTDILIAAPLNDDNGTDAGKAYFYISEPKYITPLITEQPHDQTVLVGETATFICNFDGPTNKGYQWWRVPYVSHEESKIVDIPGKIEGATTNQLKIINTSLEGN